MSAAYVSPQKGFAGSSTPSPAKRQIIMQHNMVVQDLKLQQAVTHRGQQSHTTVTASYFEDHTNNSSQTDYNLPGEGERLSYPSMAQLKLMGPPSHNQANSYINGRHIRNVRIPEE